MSRATSSCGLHMLADGSEGKGYEERCPLSHQRNPEARGRVEQAFEEGHQRELHVTIPAGEFKQHIGVVGFAPKCTASPCAA